MLRNLIEIRWLITADTRPHKDKAKRTSNKRNSKASANRYTENATFTMGSFFPVSSVEVRNIHSNGSGFVDIANDSKADEEMTSNDTVLVSNETETDIFANETTPQYVLMSQPLLTLNDSRSELGRTATFVHADTILSVKKTELSRISKNTKIPMLNSETSALAIHGSVISSLKNNSESSKYFQELSTIASQTSETESSVEATNEPVSFPSNSEALRLSVSSFTATFQDLQELPTSSFQVSPTRDLLSTPPLQAGLAFTATFQDLQELPTSSFQVSPTRDLLSTPPLQAGLAFTATFQDLQELPTSSFQVSPTRDLLSTPPLQAGLAFTATFQDLQELPTSSFQVSPTRDLLSTPPSQASMTESGIFVISTLPEVPYSVDSLNSVPVQSSPVLTRNRNSPILGPRIVLETPKMTVEPLLSPEDELIKRTPALSSTREKYEITSSPLESGVVTDTYSSEGIPQRIRKTSMFLSVRVKASEIETETDDQLSNKTFILPEIYENVLSTESVEFSGMTSRLFVNSVVPTSQSVLSGGSRNSSPLPLETLMTSPKATEENFQSLSLFTKSESRGKEIPEKTEAAVEGYNATVLESPRGRIINKDSLIKATSDITSGRPFVSSSFIPRTNEALTVSSTENSMRMLSGGAFKTYLTFENSDIASGLLQQSQNVYPWRTVSNIVPSPSASTRDITLETTSSTTSSEQITRASRSFRVQVERDNIPFITPGLEEPPDLSSKSSGGMYNSNSYGGIYSSGEMPSTITTSAEQNAQLQNSSTVEVEQTQIPSVAPKLQGLPSLSDVSSVQIHPSTSFPNSNSFSVVHTDQYADLKKSSAVEMSEIERYQIPGVTPNLPGLPSLANIPPLKKQTSFSSADTSSLSIMNTVVITSKQSVQVTSHSMLQDGLDGVSVITPRLEEFERSSEASSNETHSPPSFVETHSSDVMYPTVMVSSSEQRLQSSRSSRIQMESDQISAVTPRLQELPSLSNAYPKEINHLTPGSNSLSVMHSTIISSPKQYVHLSRSSGIMQKKDEIPVVMVPLLDDFSSVSNDVPRETPIFVSPSGVYSTIMTPIEQNAQSNTHNGSDEVSATTSSLNRLPSLQYVPHREMQQAFDVTKSRVMHTTALSSSKQNAYSSSHFRTNPDKIFIATSTPGELVSLEDNSSSKSQFSVSSSDAKTSGLVQASIASSFESSKLAEIRDKIPVATPRLEQLVNLSEILSSETRSSNSFVQTNSPDVKYGNDFELFAAISTSEQSSKPVQSPRLAFTVTVGNAPYNTKSKIASIAMGIGDIEGSDNTSEPSTSTYQVPSFNQKTLRTTSQNGALSIPPLYLSPVLTSMMPSSILHVNAEQPTSIVSARFNENFSPLEPTFIQKNAPLMPSLTGVKLHSTSDLQQEMVVELSLLNRWPVKPTLNRLPNQGIASSMSSPHGEALFSNVLYEVRTPALLNIPTEVQVSSNRVILEMRTLNSMESIISVKPTEYATSVSLQRKVDLESLASITKYLALPQQDGKNLTSSSQSRQKDITAISSSGLENKNTPSEEFESLSVSLSTSIAGIVSSPTAMPSDAFITTILHPSNVLNETMSLEGALLGTLFSSDTIKIENISASISATSVVFQPSPFGAFIKNSVNVTTPPLSREALNVSMSLGDALLGTLFPSDTIKIKDISASISSTPVAFQPSSIGAFIRKTVNVTSTPLSRTLEETLGKGKGKEKVVRALASGIVSSPVFHLAVRHIGELLKNETGLVHSVSRLESMLGHLQKLVLRETSKHLKTSTNLSLPSTETVTTYNGSGDISKQVNSKLESISSKLKRISSVLNALQIKRRDQNINATEPSNIERPESINAVERSSIDRPGTLTRVDKKHNKLLELLLRRFTKLEAMIQSKRDLVNGNNPTTKMKGSSVTSVTSSPLLVISIAGDSSRMLHSASSSEFVQPYRINSTISPTSFLTSIPRRVLSTELTITPSHNRLSVTAKTTSETTPLSVGLATSLASADKSSANKISQTATFATSKLNTASSAVGITHPVNHTQRPNGTRHVNRSKEFTYVTFRGGLEAGVFTDRGKVKTMETCVELCYYHPTCHVAFMVGHTCYSIQCYSQKTCEVLPVATTVINTRVVYLKDRMLRLPYTINSHPTATSLLTDSNFTIKNCAKNITVLKNMTFLAGMSAGNFTDYGAVDTIQACSNICCSKKVCDAAFMILNNCFTIDCVSDKACHAIPSKSHKVNTSIVYFRKTLSKKRFESETKRASKIKEQQPCPLLRGILRDVTFNGGINAGNFTDHGFVDEFPSCIEKCCRSPNCDIAFMVEQNCYSVKCAENKKRCLPVIARAKKFKTYMALKKASYFQNFTLPVTSDGGCVQTGQTQYGLTLKRGIKAGNFTAHGKVNDMSRCLHACCSSPSCDAAFMIDKNCYSVSCATKRDCETVTAKKVHFTTSLAFVNRTQHESKSHTTSNAEAGEINDFTKTILEGHCDITDEQQNVNITGGLKAGKFLRLPDIKDMKKCTEACCEYHGCGAAMFIDQFCYNLICFKKRGCHFIGTKKAFMINKFVAVRKNVGHVLSPFKKAQITLSTASKQHVNRSMFIQVVQNANRVRNETWTLNLRPMVNSARRDNAYNVSNEYVGSHSIQPSRARFETSSKFRDGRISNLNAKKNAIPLPLLSQQDGLIPSASFFKMSSTASMYQNLSIGASRTSSTTTKIKVNRTDNNKFLDNTIPRTPILSSLPNSAIINKPSVSSVRRLISYATPLNTSRTQANASLLSSNKNENDVFLAQNRVYSFKSDYSLLKDENTNNRKRSYACTHTFVFNNSTLRGGLRAGDVKNEGLVEGMEQCVDMCCKTLECNVALLINETCYIVACTNKKSCEAIPVKDKETRSNTKVAYVARSSDEAQLIKQLISHTETSKMNDFSLNKSPNNRTLGNKDLPTTDVVVSEGSCIRSPVLRDVRLKLGKHSGDFKSVGKVANVDECVALCCKASVCNAIFMLGSRCHLVSCSNEVDCQTVVAKSEFYKPTVVYLARNKAEVVYFLKMIPKELLEKYRSDGIGYADTTSDEDELAVRRSQLERTNDSGSIESSLSKAPIANFTATIKMPLQRSNAFPLQGNSSSFTSGSASATSNLTLKVSKAFALQHENTTALGSENAYGKSISTVESLNVVPTLLGITPSVSSGNFRKVPHHAKGIIPTLLAITPSPGSVNGITASNPALRSSNVFPAFLEPTPVRESVSVKANLNGTMESLSHLSSAIKNRHQSFSSLDFPATISPTLGTSNVFSSLAKSHLKAHLRTPHVSTNTSQITSKKDVPGSSRRTLSPSMGFTTQSISAVISTIVQPISSVVQSRGTVNPSIIQLIHQSFDLRGSSSHSTVDIHTGPKTTESRGVVKKGYKGTILMGSNAPSLVDSHLSRRVFSSIYDSARKSVTRNASQLPSSRIHRTPSPEQTTLNARVSRFTVPPGLLANTLGTPFPQTVQLSSAKNINAISSSFIIAHRYNSGDFTSTSEQMSSVQPRESDNVIQYKRVDTVLLKSSFFPESSHVPPSSDSSVGGSYYKDTHSSTRKVFQLTKMKDPPGSKTAVLQSETPLTRPSASISKTNLSRNSSSSVSHTFLSSKETRGIPASVFHFLTSRKAIHTVLSILSFSLQPNSAVSTSGLSKPRVSTSSIHSNLLSAQHSNKRTLPLQTPSILKSLAILAPLLQTSKTASLKRSSLSTHEGRVSMGETNASPHPAQHLPSSSTSIDRRHHSSTSDEKDTPGKDKSYIYVTKTLMLSSATPHRIVSSIAYSPSMTEHGNTASRSDHFLSNQKVINHLPSSEVQQKRMEIPPFAGGLLEQIKVLHHPSRSINQHLTSGTTADSTPISGVLLEQIKPLHAKSPRAPSVSVSSRLPSNLAAKVSTSGRRPVVNEKEMLGKAELIGKFPATTLPSILVNTHSKSTTQRTAKYDRTASKTTTSRAKTVQSLSIVNDVRQSSLSRTSLNLLSRAPSPNGDHAGHPPLLHRTDSMNARKPIPSSVVQSSEIIHSKTPTPSLRDNPVPTAPGKHFRSWSVSKESETFTKEASQDVKATPHHRTIVVHTSSTEETSHDEKAGMFGYFAQLLKSIKDILTKKNTNHHDLLSSSSAVKNSSRYTSRNIATASHVLSVWNSGTRWQTATVSGELFKQSIITSVPPVETATKSLSSLQLRPSKGLDISLAMQPLPEVAFNITGIRKAALCKHSPVHKNSTMRGGVHAGLLKEIGQVNNDAECISQCCFSKTCDAAFLLLNRCFLVTCKSKRLCESVPAKTLTFRPRVIYMQNRMMLPKAGSGQTVSETSNPNIQQDISLSSRKFKISTIDHFVSASVKVSASIPRPKLQNGTQTRFCQVSSTSQNVTLRGGIKSGHFKDEGNVESMDRCIELCCSRDNCSVAFMLLNRCFTVSCYNETSCTSIPAPSLIFQPQLAYIKRDLYSKVKSTTVFKKITKTQVSTGILSSSSQLTRAEYNRSVADFHDNCRYGNTETEVTLRGGVNAGSFLDTGVVTSIEQCVSHCCHATKCDVAFMIMKRCFLVTCLSPRLCESIPARNVGYLTEMVRVSRDETAVVRDLLARLVQPSSPSFKIRNDLESKLTSSEYPRDSSTSSALISKTGGFPGSMAGSKLSKRTSDFIGHHMGSVSQTVPPAVPVQRALIESAIEPVSVNKHENNGLIQTIGMSTRRKTTSHTLDKTITPSSVRVNSLLLSPRWAESEGDVSSPGQKLETRGAFLEDEICQSTVVYYNATMRGGINAGVFKDQGPVQNMRKCIEQCCRWQFCSVAFMLLTRCYTIACYNDHLCDPVPARNVTFTPRIAFISRVRRDQGNFSDVLKNTTTPSLNLSSTTATRPSASLREKDLSLTKGKVNQASFTSSQSIRTSTTLNLLRSLEIKPSPSQLLFSKIFTPRSESRHNCTKSEPNQDVTLRGGLKAGNFKDRGKVMNIQQCVDFCCREDHCDVALMLLENCFTVRCYSKDLCESVPAKTGKYRSRIVYVKKAPDINSRSLFTHKSTKTINLLDAALLAMGERNGNETIVIEKTSTLSNAISGFNSEQLARLLSPSPSTPNGKAALRSSITYLEKESFETLSTNRSRTFSFQQSANQTLNASVSHYQHQVTPSLTSTFVTSGYKTSLLSSLTIRVNAISSAHHEPNKSSRKEGVKSDHTSGLAKTLEDSSQHSFSHPPSCLKSPISYNVTLRNGIRSGYFRDQGRVENMRECTNKCCDSNDCDVAFMLKQRCYLVTCYTKKGCQTVPARHSVFTPRVAHVQRSNVSQLASFMDEQEKVEQSHSSAKADYITSFSTLPAPVKYLNNSSKHSLKTKKLSNKKKNTPLLQHNKSKNRKIKARVEDYFGSLATHHKARHVTVAPQLKIKSVRKTRKNHHGNGKDNGLKSTRTKSSKANKVQHFKKKLEKERDQKLSHSDLDQLFRLMKPKKKVSSAKTATVSIRSHKTSNSTKTETSTPELLENSPTAATTNSVKHLIKPTWPARKSSARAQESKKGTKGDDEFAIQVKHLPLKKGEAVELSPTDGVETTPSISFQIKKKTKPTQKVTYTTSKEFLDYVLRPTAAASRHSVTNNQKQKPQKHKFLTTKSTVPSRPIQGTDLEVSRCTTHQVEYNQTLRGGMSSGLFHEVGKVNDIKRCAHHCCASPICDLAFMVLRHCFLVTCSSSNPRMCESTPALATNFKPMISRVSRSGSRDMSAATPMPNSKPAPTVKPITSPPTLPPHRPKALPPVAASNITNNIPSMNPIHPPPMSISATQSTTAVAGDGSAHVTKATIVTQHTALGCIASLTERNVTLKGGLHAGKFTDAGHVNGTSACTKLCCKASGCDVAFYAFNRCFLVKCFDEFLCGTTPSLLPNFNPTVVHVYRHHSNPTPKPPTTLPALNDVLQAIEDETQTKLKSDTSVNKTCKHSEVYNEVTLRMGYKAGNFTSHGRVNSTNQCVEFCCKERGCDLIFMFLDNCFTVSCSSGYACEIVPARQSRFNPKVVYFITNNSSTVVKPSEFNSSLSGSNLVGKQFVNVVHYQEARPKKKNRKSYKEDFSQMNNKIQTVDEEFVVLPDKKITTRNVIKATETRKAQASKFNSSDQLPGKSILHSKTIHRKITLEGSGLKSQKESNSGDLLPGKSILRNKTIHSKITLKGSGLKSHKESKTEQKMDIMINKLTNVTEENKYLEGEIRVLMAKQSKRGQRKKSISLGPANGQSRKEREKRKKKRKKISHRRKETKSRLRHSDPGIDSNAAKRVVLVDTDRPPVFAPTDEHNIEEHKIQTFHRKEHGKTYLLNLTGKLLPKKKSLKKQRGYLKNTSKQLNSTSEHAIEERVIYISGNVSGHPKVSRKHPDVGVKEGMEGKYGQPEPDKDDLQLDEIVNLKPDIKPEKPVWDSSGNKNRDTMRNFHQNKSEDEFQIEKQNESNTPKEEVWLNSRSKNSDRMESFHDQIEEKKPKQSDEFQIEKQKQVRKPKEQFRFTSPKRNEDRIESFQKQAAPTDQSDFELDGNGKKEKTNEDGFRIEKQYEQKEPVEHGWMSSKERNQEQMENFHKQIAPTHRSPFKLDQKEEKENAREHEFYVEKHREQVEPEETVWRSKNKDYLKSFHEQLATNHRSGFKLDAQRKKEYDQEEEEVQFKNQDHGKKREGKVWKTSRNKNKDHLESFYEQIAPTHSVHFKFDNQTKNEDVGEDESHPEPQHKKLLLEVAGGKPEIMNGKEVEKISVQKEPKPSFIMSKSEPVLSDFAQQDNDTDKARYEHSIERPVFVKSDFGNNNKETTKGNGMDSYPQHDKEEKETLRHRKPDLDAIFNNISIIYNHLQALIERYSRQNATAGKDVISVNSRRREELIPTPPRSSGEPTHSRSSGKPTPRMFIKLKATLTPSKKIRVVKQYVTDSNRGSEASSRRPNDSLLDYMKTIYSRVQELYNRKIKPSTLKEKNTHRRKKDHRAFSSGNKRKGRKTNRKKTRSRIAIKHQQKTGEEELVLKEMKKIYKNMKKMYYEQKKIQRNSEIKTRKALRQNQRSFIPTSSGVQESVSKLKPSGMGPTIERTSPLNRSITAAHDKPHVHKAGMYPPSIVCFYSKAINGKTETVGY